MHLQNYLLQTNIHYKKNIYCKKYIDWRKKIIAKKYSLQNNIHCKEIFIARRTSWRKSIFFATCVNRGFPIICTCKNTEPTHRIALWVQETPHSTKSQKSVLKKPDMKYERADKKFDLSYWSKQAPSEWANWTHSIGKSSIEFPNNICQSLVLFSYQYKLIEFSLKLYPYRKARGWIPLEDPIVRKEGIDEGCLSKLTHTHSNVYSCMFVFNPWPSYQIKSSVCFVFGNLRNISTFNNTLNFQHANSQKSLPPVSYIKVGIMLCTVVFWYQKRKS